MTSLRYCLQFAIPAALALWIDLASKYYFFALFEQNPASRELVPGFLYISEARNTGVAFGMLQGHNAILAVFVAIMALGIPLYGYFQRREGGLFLFALGLVYGGALGNLYDRWFIHYVRDFIDVRIASYHYPVFNGADSFICIGVALMVLQSWLTPRAPKT